MKETAMPKAWSDKDERMYEHVKASEEKKRGGKRAKEIAARTVNKHRKEEGRTKEQQGSKSKSGSSKRSSKSRGKSSSSGRSKSRSK